MEHIGDELVCLYISVFIDINRVKDSVSIRGDFNRFVLLLHRESNVVRHGHGLEPSNENLDRHRSANDVTRTYQSRA